MKKLFIIGLLFLAACGREPDAPTPDAPTYDFIIEAHFKNATSDTFTCTGESVAILYDGELYVYRKHENYRMALGVNYFKILKKTEVK